jgi:hypothetical protein
MRLELPYAPRPIRPLGLWAFPAIRLKVYGIAHGRPLPRSELVDAARHTVERHLRDNPTRHRSHGAGFVGIHDGRGENQVFLDVWINDNELLHHCYTSPPASPADLRPPAAGSPHVDHTSVCVWDLAVQCFERQAWLTHVLTRPGGPDLEGYLAARLSADV